MSAIIAASAPLAFLFAKPPAPSVAPRLVMPAGPPEAGEPGAPTGAPRMPRIPQTGLDLRILQHLTDAGEPLTARDLSARLSLPYSTVIGYLTPMRKNGSIVRIGSGMHIRWAAPGVATEPQPLPAKKLPQRSDAAAPPPRGSAGPRGTIPRLVLVVDADGTPRLYSDLPARVVQAVNVLLSLHSEAQS